MRQKSTLKLSFKHMWLLCVLIIFMLVVVSLIRNLFDLLSVGERLVLAEKEVHSLRQEHSELQALSDRVSAGELEEEVIREELGLVKPGEVIVVIPEDILAEPATTAAALEEIRTFIPVWKQWVNLLVEGT